MHSAKKKREENLEDFSCTPQFFFSLEVDCLFSEINSCIVKSIFSLSIL